MIPKVSICVPNLNTRPYLPERFRTIQEQSFQDWELLVYDSYSDDGAWEYISQLAASEPRMHIWQGPREGSPVCWNPCIRKARGEYVYVATSDDTMAPDCLEKLVAALDAHPECDLAHCAVKVIDQHGREGSDWWARGSVFARSSGPLLGRTHVRRAPFDGLLHLLGESVYISITQLLIRRSLFDRIGYFESTWGSVSDFNWSMRAGLAASTIHVADTWGGWRLHPAQATAQAALGSVEHVRRIDGMIEHALESSDPFLPPAVRERLEGGWAERLKDLRDFRREIATHGTPAGRRRFVLRRLLAGSAAAREHVKSALLRTPSWHSSFADDVRCWLEAVDSSPVLSAVPVHLAGVSAPFRVPGKRKPNFHPSDEVIAHE